MLTFIKYKLIFTRGLATDLFSQEVFPKTNYHILGLKYISSS